MCQKYEIKNLEKNTKITALGIEPGHSESWFPSARPLGHTEFTQHWEKITPLNLSNPIINISIIIFEIQI